MPAHRCQYGSGPSPDGTSDTHRCRERATVALVFEAEAGRVESKTTEKAWYCDQHAALVRRVYRVLEAAA